MGEVDPPERQRRWRRSGCAPKAQSNTLSPALSGRTLSARFAGTFPVKGKEGVYGVHDSIELLVDLVVPNSVHPEALSSQPGIPVSIVALVIW